MKLFALPYAFGNKSRFRQVKQLIEERSDIEFVALDYPGHGSRYSENCLLSINAIARDIFKQIEHFLREDYIVLGYSMGGLIAYELYQIICDSDYRLPKALILMASNSPMKHYRYRSYESFSTADTTKILKRLGLTNPVIVKNTELMDILSEVVKADLIAMRDYVKKFYQISSPIHLIYGNREKGKKKSVKEWQQFSSQPVNYHKVVGGHFFLFEKEDINYEMELLLDIIHSSRG